jgi:hypothetical protein
MIQNIQQYGFLTIIEERNDAGEEMITFEYAGNMGATMESIDELLAEMEWEDLDYWKIIYPVWEEQGDPSYFYTISFYL